MTKTAVAAPAADPWDDIFETIDAMSKAEMDRFIEAFEARYGRAQREKRRRDRYGLDDIPLKETIG